MKEKERNKILEENKTRSAKGQKIKDHWEKRRRRVIRQTKKRERRGWA